MNIDERLARLAERHEALLQAVKRIGHPQESREGTHRNNEILFEKNKVRLAEIMKSLNTLARIAHARERRSSDRGDGRT
jgi:hypothetical protein